MPDAKQPPSNSLVSRPERKAHPFCDCCCELSKAPGIWLGSESPLPRAYVTIDDPPCCFERTKGRSRREMSSDEEQDNSVIFSDLEFGAPSDAAGRDRHIGPLHSGGCGYTHQADSYSIDVHDQPEKGLSFQIWPSSHTLIRYLELPVHDWQGKHVLELGCGCGLVGLCAAACGAHVLLTDLPEPLELTRQNIRVNEQTIQVAGGSAAAQELSWGVTSVSQLPEEWQAPDTILAADVVYRQDLFQPLLHSLDKLCGPSTVVLLAHVRRWKRDKRFFKALSKTFSITDITSTVDEDANHFTSNTRGALRLFQLRRLNP